MLGLKISTTTNAQILIKFLALSASYIYFTEMINVTDFQNRFQALVIGMAPRLDNPINIYTHGSNTGMIH